MSERIEYVCNNKSDCHHCHLLEEIKYGNSIVVCDEVLTGPNMIYDLEQENAKLKAELEKSQCMLAGFMVAEDQEKARLKERIALLEKLLKKAETYVSTPEIVSHEDKDSLRYTIHEVAKMNIYKIPGDASLTLPQGLEVDIKNCEASDDKI